MTIPESIQNNASEIKNVVYEMSSIFLRLSCTNPSIWICTVTMMQVRVSPEGLNVTVCGLVADTELYMQAVTAHPLFQDMTLEDFKVGSMTWWKKFLVLMSTFKMNRFYPHQQKH